MMRSIARDEGAAMESEEELDSSLDQQFAAVLRRVWEAASGSAQIRTGLTLGVTSCTRGEGVTTIARFSMARAQISARHVAQSFRLSLPAGMKISSAPRSESAVPPLKAVGDGHLVACWQYE